MSLLSPAATYHAELREQLSGVGRALFLQRALRWLARGLVLGAAIVLGLVIWAWTRDGVSSLPIAGLVAIPLATAALGVIASLFIRYQTPDLARRVDSAARLQERSTTALELGAGGADYPLALAQMRDAVEHLKRVDLFDAFPLKAPRTELLAAFFIGVVAAIVAFSPNPWLLRARAANPAITIAQEQAQRVQRLADSIQPQDSAELEALRQLVSKGARTIEARSAEPDAALNSLQDLEEQVRQMSAGDDQLSAALAAIAGALAADPTTQQLSSAINTGDMREISQATKDLAQASDRLSGQDRERVAKTLRDAANRAGRVSPSVSGDLSDAADALQAGAGAQAGDGAMESGGAQTRAGQTGQGQPGSSGQAQNGRSAADALNQLSSSAAAAGERQRATSQLESSRNALERALGRTQSRSGSSGRSSSSQRGQSAAGAQAGDQSQGAGQGQAGDQGEGADGAGGGAPGTGQGEGGDTGQGGGYSSGGQSQNRAGGAGTGLDAITRPEQVPNGGGVVPDESSMNPYLGEAGEGNSRAADEAVQPAFSRKSTTGNDTSAIPLGLRDLVKDYFSSLDQNQK
jgi:hypothetical protein